MNGMQKMLDFLTRLDEATIPYSLEHNRDESVTILASVPSERWEVEFFADGSVEVEVFYSNAAEDGLEDESALTRLFAVRDEEDYEFGEDDDELEDEDELDDEDDEFEDDFEDDEEDRLVNNRH